MMRMIRHAVIILILATVVTAAHAQNVQGLEPYIQSLEYPDALSLRMTGVFRSTDFQTYAHKTIDLFDDPSVVFYWMTVAGERYDYELALESDADWQLRSLALSFLRQTAARSEPAAPAERLSLSGSFIANWSGLLLPHYEAEGEAERDCSVEIATLVPPDPSRFTTVESDDPRVRLARFEVLDFVKAAEALGGEAVLYVNAPEGSEIKLWTIGYPAAETMIAPGEEVSTDALPRPPWSLSIRLPQGMTIDDVAEGELELNLHAEGITPEWLTSAGVNPLQ